MSDALGDWIGTEKTEEDRVTRSRVRQMLALLDRDPDTAAEGDPLPAGWHWLFFNPAPPRSRLGPDGHEKRGDFLPPVALPRRMWAGGRLAFRAPLHVGDRVRRRSTVRSIEEKEGRSGRLVFVTVRHEVRAEGGEVAVEEEQDLVYREASQGGPPTFRGPEVPEERGWSEAFVADEVTLFRFSALTFNGHRIHYDHPYATQEEGYPGLVVHGPLLALLLLDGGMRHGVPDPSGFRYRATSPVFCGESVRLEGAGGEGAGAAEVWAASPGRGVAMRGTLE